MLSSPFSNSDSQFQIPENAQGYPRPCTHSTAATSEVTRDRTPVYKAMLKSNGMKCLWKSRTLKRTPGIHLGTDLTNEWGGRAGTHLTKWILWPPTTQSLHRLFKRWFLTHCQDWITYKLILIKWTCICVRLIYSLATCLDNICGVKGTAVIAILHSKTETRKKGQRA